MKIKRKHWEKGLRKTLRVAKKARPVVIAVAPVIIEVIADVVPGATALRVAAKVTKAL